MMTRSAPPLSANFAERPIPAPAAITGLPAASVLLRRSRTSFREYFIAASLSNERKKAVRRLRCERIAIDVGVHLDQRHIGSHIGPKRGEQRVVGLRVVEGLALHIDVGDALLGDHQHRWPFRPAELRSD